MTTIKEMFLAYQQVTPDEVAAAVLVLAEVVRDARPKVRQDFLEAVGRAYGGMEGMRERALAESLASD